MQRHIDFFYYAGFDCFQPSNKENWQGPGIKLDFGDYATAVDPTFDGESYFQPPTPATLILGQRETTETDYDKVMDEIEERPSVSAGNACPGLEPGRSSGRIVLDTMPATNNSGVRARSAHFFLRRSCRR
jgi:hypothetical protein